MPAWPPKHPDAVYDYRFDPPLDPGDTVATINVTSVSGSVTIDSEDTDPTGITVWLSGGANGETAIFLATWLTAGGRSDEDYITLPVTIEAISQLTGPEASPGVAGFSYAMWSALYPELTGPLGIQAAQAQALFVQAGTLYLDNTPGSRVQDVAQRQSLLYLIVAHLAKLKGWSNTGLQPTGFVGRITEAQEGSVRVKTADIGGGSATEAWWTQTPYGFDYWQATSQYRTMTYVPGPERNFEPWGALRAAPGFWPWPG